VNVNSWHQKKKQTITSSKTVKGAINKTLTYNYRSPGLEQDHADDLAMNKANEAARHEIELQLNLVGDPSIDVGMGLQLIGTAFAQTFEMDHICHQIGPGGYTMQITAKSARAGRGSGEITPSLSNAPTPPPRPTTPTPPPRPTPQSRSTGG
jgi:hypothetical protein